VDADHAVILLELWAGINPAPDPGASIPWPDGATLFQCGIPKDPLQRAGKGFGEIAKYNLASFEFRKQNQRHILRLPNELALWFS
jgi:hypothetical protein